MKLPHRYLVLPALAYVPLAAGCVLGLYVARATAIAVGRDLLRSETAVAVELLGETRNTAVLDGFFADRWRLTEAVDPLLDEAVVVDGPGGIFGKAPVYDSDAWFQVGTLFLSASPDSRPRLPPAVLLATLVALLILFPIAVGWAKPSTAAAPRSRRTRTHLGFALAALLVVAWPMWTGGRWAARTLERATAQRLQLAVDALEAVPDLEALIERPGGVYQVTGLSFILLDHTGAVALSSLPPAATEDLARLPPPARGLFVADRVPYAIADVGRVRLATLPYEHTNQPLPAMLVIALLATALAALPASLATFASEPRVLRRNLVAWSFIGPSFVHLAIFTAGPLLFAAWLSLHRWNLLDAARPFVGFANYGDLVGDPLWWNAIGNTAVFTLHVPVSMAVALALALLLYGRVRGFVLLRALLFLPSITSLVAIAIIWQWMLHDEYGLINLVISLLGFEPVRWLTSPKTALLAIMLMSIWMVAGYQLILFQAGLTAIPRELYDAARIDGAGLWRRFLHVTLPGLRHTLFFVLVTSVIGSFQIFGAVYVMTEGGPLHATDVAVFHIYEEAWEFFRFGSAAAMSWVLFAIIFLVTWVQFRTLEQRGERGA